MTRYQGQDLCSSSLGVLHRVRYTVICQYADLNQIYHFNFQTHRYHAGSLIKNQKMKFSHIGIPTTEPFEGEIDLPHLKMTVSDHENNPYGIQWQRYWKDAPYPELVKTKPHVAFEVEDLYAEIEGKKIIIEPNSPSEGLTVAFIEVNGAPVELMEYK